jgi:RimJ/RimL family protein N-acetyltransferase
MDLTDNYFMVLADGSPVGTISINTVSREIGRVMLGYKKWAREGIMGEALEQLISTFGYDSYYLKVLAGNQAAIDFYKKHDFFGYGETDGYLHMERVM